MGVLNTQIEVDFNSFNGWIINELGYIPDIGETFDYPDLTVEILNSDGRQFRLRLSSIRKALNKSKAFLIG